MAAFAAVNYTFIASLLLFNVMSYDLTKRDSRSISTNFGPHSTYVGENGHTCYVCRPGFYFISDCTSNFTTAMCKECNQGTYNTRFSIAIKCATCASVCIDRNAEIISQCNATVDTKCQCKDGYYNHSTGPGEWRCLPHTKCEPGKESYWQGTSTNDTICIKCKKGYYSTSKSATEKCIPCRACSSEQDSIPCNSIEDTVCSVKGQQVFLEIGLPIILSVFAAGVMAIILVLCRYKTFSCRRDNNNEPSKEPINQYVETPIDLSVVATSMPAHHFGPFAYQTGTRALSIKVTNEISRNEWSQLILSLVDRLTKEEGQFVIRSLIEKYYDVFQIKSRLDTICFENPNNVKEQKYQGFMLWLQRAGDDACLEDILSALKANRITGLDVELKKRFQNLLRNQVGRNVQLPNTTAV